MAREKQTDAEAGVLRRAAGEWSYLEMHRP